MTEETLFHEALAKPLAERAAFLDKACAGQPELRAAVEALLAAHEPPADVPDRPEPNAASTTDYHPSVAPGGVIAGRYTLVQKIGEGGMGEVWVAKQTEPVKRKVALKLIKAGLDSRAVVARFEQERQALAMMDHPNIAKVLDGGVVGPVCRTGPDELRDPAAQGPARQAGPTGQPFFVMELVNGLPLTKFCDQARLSLRERLELFVPVCQAVQHAHYKGIVHRDLKPANILVTLIDGRPVPKVIDFGVAKATGGKLTDESMATQFGAVVGTLEYMSPEQTGYSGMDIDTRADIYSLGVILYELLTGLKPIDAKRLKKAAYAEMIRIIQEEEPSKPSTRLSTDASLPSLAALRQTEPRKLMALLRGELDWVVMKCLEKQRERRYATANGLAADIQRYLADEAVEARPPSAGNRLSKFLKRNKKPVIAASMLLLALLCGIAGTTWGMIQADRARAAEAERVTERDEALGKATAARSDLEKANTKLNEAQDELLKSHDQLLSSTARVLLRPLAVQVRPNQPLPPLNDQEIEALWDLASSKDGRLRLRFVEVALQDPVSTRRLKDRAAFALQAAVGLNGKLRSQVEELLGKRLQAKGTPPEQQDDVALCLAHLGILGQPLAGRTAATLTQAMSKTTDPHAIESLSQGLTAVAARLEPKEAGKAYGQAAVTLTQAMSKMTDANALGPLSECLSAVAAHLEPKEAAQTCGQAAVTLSQAMNKATKLYTLSSLTRGLSAVAGRMEPREAAATLTQAMSKTTDSIALHYLSKGLSAVAAGMEPKEAAATLTQAMSKTANLNVLRILSQGLSAVAARMEPKEAGATLTQAISKTTDPYVLGSLTRGLSAVAARLQPKEAAQACGRAAATLTQAMSKTTDTNALGSLAQSLSAVAARLEPKEAAQACGQAATTLTQAMSKTTDPNALGSLAQSLPAVAAWLEPKEAAQACGQAATTLTHAMTKTTDPTTLWSLSSGLVAVAARLEPREAAQACGQAAATLSQAMSKTTDTNALGSLAHSLSAVAAHLEPKEAAQACGQAAATLSQAMSNTTEPGARWILARGMSAVAAHLETKEAAHAGGHAAVTLTQAMSKTTDPYVLGSLAQGLSTVAARLEPKEAAQACGKAAAILTQAMSKTTDSIRLGSLAQGLSTVAARLEPKEAAQACGEAAAILTQAMSKTTDPTGLVFLSRGGLSSVLSRQSSTTRRERYTNATATIATLGGPGLPFAALAWAQLAPEPAPPPLSPRTLVDILKQPFCVGEARRLVLEQLTRHYHRPFADQWEFVDYAHQHKLDLDLTTPPQPAQGR